MDITKPRTYSCSQECVLKNRHYVTRNHLTAKPLTYLSFKCVLKYTDPNIRLQLASVCAEFRYTEKISPLNIDKLNMNSTSFNINGTDYNLGVIRHYRGVPPPAWVPDRNAEGGESHDVGEFEKPRFGNSKPQTKEKRTPSDKETLRNFECEQKKKLRPNELKKKKKIEEEVEIHWDHIYSRYGFSLKFEHYLQLTITSNSGTKLIERMKYDRPIKESMDYFYNKFLLGGRAYLNVGTLRFDYLPEVGDFKFRAKHLIIGHVDRVKAENALDEIACPLESKEVIEREWFIRPGWWGHRRHPFRM